MEEKNNEEIVSVQQNSAIGATIKSFILKVQVFRCDQCRSVLAFEDMARVIHIPRIAECDYSCCVRCIGAAR